MPTPEKSGHGAQAINQDVKKHHVHFRPHQTPPGWGEENGRNGESRIRTIPMMQLRPGTNRKK
jgi:hypothetical protein